NETRPGPICPRINRRARRRRAVVPCEPGRMYFVEERSLAADLGHATDGIALAFRDAMAPRFAPDAAFELGEQIVVRRTVAHHVTEVDLIGPEKEKPELAIGGEADA